MPIWIHTLRMYCKFFFHIFLGRYRRETGYIEQSFKSGLVKVRMKNLQKDRIRLFFNGIQAERLTAVIRFPSIYIDRNRLFSIRFCQKYVSKKVFFFLIYRSRATKKICIFAASLLDMLGLLWPNDISRKKICRKILMN